MGLLLPPVCSVCPHWAWAQVPSSHGTYYCPSDHSLSVPGMKAKKPIQTKFRMPLLNWVALKPNQITGTVFTELNDEKVLQVSGPALLPVWAPEEGGDLPGSCWALGVVTSSTPFYGGGHGGPRMGVKPNWTSASRRQCVLTPLEAFPPSLQRGSSLP